MNSQNKEKKKGTPWGILIVIAAIYGVTSTFKLDKAWKEYQAK